MKKILTILMSVVFATGAFAFSGHITSNTTWSNDMTITGDVWIDPGVTLTIMPGVTVSFTKVDQNADGIGDIDFIVEGKLMCQGTASQKVYFTSNETNPQPSDWGGIDYTTDISGALSTITYTEFLYAHEAFHLNGRNVTFNLCRIANSGAYGLYVESTDYVTTLNNCMIENSATYGIQADAGEIAINSLTTYNNGTFGFKANTGAIVNADDLIASSNGTHGIWVNATTGSIFTDSRSTSNGNDGIYIENANPSFDDCMVKNNSWSGVYVTGATTNATFTKMTVNENTKDGFRFMDGAFANVAYTEICFNNGYGVQLNSSTPTFNYNNIHSNVGLGGEQITKSFSSSEWKSTGSIVYHPSSSFDNVYITSITVKADADYYSSYHFHRYKVKLVCKGSTKLDYYYNPGQKYSYNPPVQTWTIDINDYVCNYDDLYVSQYYSVDCSNPRIWVESYSGYIGSADPYQIAGLNSAGTNSDFEHNWFNQVNGVDTLILQSSPGIISYSQIETSEVTNAGATLTNLTPSLTLTAPGDSVLLNPATIDINWNDLDLDNNANISLYYTGTQGTDGTEIIGSISEDDNGDTYTWDVSSVPHDYYYIYGVIDDGVNTPVQAYAPFPVMVGPLSANAPTDAKGAAGSQVMIPVRVVNTLEAFNIVSFQFTMTYNMSTLSAVGVSTAGTLTENWSVSANTTIPGTVSVIGYAVNPLLDDGDLVYVTFDVDAGANNYDSSPLNIGEFIFNDGIDGTAVNNGTFTVVNQYSVGGDVKYYHADNTNYIEDVTIDVTGGETFSAVTDASGNFSFPSVSAGNYTLNSSYSGDVPSMCVSPFDASLTSRYAIGLVSFTSDQQLAADVSDDGSITGYDAALMAQYSVGLLNEFPAGTWKMQPDDVSLDVTSDVTNQQFTGLVYGDVSGNWAPDAGSRDISDFNIPMGYEGTITIPVSSEDEFFSTQAVISYDNEKVEFIGITEASILSNYQVINNNNSSTVNFAAYSDNAFSTNEPVYVITFQTLSPIEDASSITINTINFDEVSVDANLTVTGVEDINSLSTELCTNYPNPFNGSTTFNFNVAEKTNVSIELYNVNGQMISSITNGLYTKGQYSVNWNSGDLAAGVYYCKMTAGKYVNVKSVAIVK